MSECLNVSRNRWSPEENKFAVGSGAKIISVCYYEKDNDWWVAKHIKKPLKSTVTCLDWHPNNILLAAGSTDFKVRVYSGYIREIEDKPSPTAWGNRMPMGNLMTEFSNSQNGGGWVHAVSFSGDGSKLAWVGHDSSISVADAAKDLMVMKLRTDLLPMLTLTWLTSTRILAAGHNCVPITFNLDTSGSLTLGARLEEDKKLETTGTISARDIFKNKDKMGISELETRLNTTHQNQVNLDSVILTNISQFLIRFLSFAFTRETRTMSPPSPPWLGMENWFFGTSRVFPARWGT